MSRMEDFSMQRGLPKSRLDSAVPAQGSALAYVSAAPGPLQGKIGEGGWPAKHERVGCYNHLDGCCDSSAQGLDTQPARTAFMVQPWSVPPASVQAPIGRCSMIDGGAATPLTSSAPSSSGLATLHVLEEGLPGAHMVPIAPLHISSPAGRERSMSCSPMPVVGQSISSCNHTSSPFMQPSSYAAPQQVLPPGALSSGSTVGGGHGSSNSSAGGMGGSAGASSTYQGVVPLPRPSPSGNTWGAILHVGSERLPIGTFPSALAAAQGHDIVVQQLRAAGPAVLQQLNAAVGGPSAPAPAGPFSSSTTADSPSVSPGMRKRPAAVSLEGADEYMRDSKSPRMVLPAGSLLADVQPSPGGTTLAAGAAAAAAMPAPSQRLPVVCGYQHGVFDVATNLFTLADGTAAQRGMTGTEFERRAGQGSRKKWRNSVFVCDRPGGAPVEPIGAWLERFERDVQLKRQREQEAAEAAEMGHLGAVLLNFPDATYPPAAVSHVLGRLQSRLLRKLLLGEQPRPGSSVVGPSRGAAEPPGGAPAAPSSQQHQQQQRQESGAQAAAKPPPASRLAPSAMQQGLGAAAQAVGAAGGSMIGVSTPALPPSLAPSMAAAMLPVVEAPELSLLGPGAGGILLEVGDGLPVLDGLPPDADLADLLPGGPLPPYEQPWDAHLGGGWLDDPHPPLLSDFP